MRVVISGASSGIGLALAKQYLDRGAQVATLARRLAPLESLAKQFPGQVHPYSIDVRDTEAVRQAAEDFMTQVGCPDIVIANAGVSVGTLTSFAEDTAVFQQVIDINVLGMVKTFQPFLERMQHARHGTLVGISSVAGFRGLPGASAYSASKAAAISYLESLRVELRGSGIRVVTICPGYIRTPMTAKNPYPMPFMLDADVAAKRMVSAISRQKSLVVIPWQMGWVGAMMKCLPRWLYDLLFANAPHKPRQNT